MTLDDKLTPVLTERNERLEGLTATKNSPLTLGQLTNMRNRLSWFGFGATRNPINSVCDQIFDISVSVNSVNNI